MEKIKMKYFITFCFLHVLISSLLVLTLFRSGLIGSILDLSVDLWDGCELVVTAFSVIPFSLNR